MRGRGWARRRRRRPGSGRAGRCFRDRRHPRAGRHRPRGLTRMPSSGPALRHRRGAATPPAPPGGYRPALARVPEDDVRVRPTHADGLCTLRRCRLLRRRHAVHPHATHAGGGDVLRRDRRSELCVTIANRFRWTVVLARPGRWRSLVPVVRRRYAHRLCLPHQHLGTRHHREAKQATDHSSDQWRWSPEPGPPPQPTEASELRLRAEPGSRARLHQCRYPVRDVTVQPDPSTRPPRAAPAVPGPDAVARTC